MTLIIETYEDLMSIKRGEISNYDHIHFGGGFKQKLKDKDALHWEKRIEKDFFECGCSAGAFTMLSTLFLYMAFILLLSDNIKFGLPVFLIGFGIAFITGGIVKYLVVYKARKRLKQTIQIVCNLCFNDQLI